jgi:hypothetical protein
MQKSAYTEAIRVTAYRKGLLRRLPILLILILTRRPALLELLLELTERVISRPANGADEIDDIGASLANPASGVGGKLTPFPSSCAHHGVAGRWQRLRPRSLNAGAAGALCLPHARCLRGNGPDQ